MTNEKSAKADQILIECRNSWNSLADFRARRRRSRNYFRNKPQEKVFDPDTNQWVDEDTYIEAQGRTPIKINRVRPVLKNLKGQFRSNKTSRLAYPRNREDTLAGEMMSEGLRYVTDVNQADEVDADMVTEALLSGLWGYKEYYAFHPDLVRDEIIIDPIDPPRMFFTTNLRDRRMTGLNLIGELHDLTLDEIVSKFARNRRHADELRGLYGQYAEPWAAFTMGGFSGADMRDFYQSSDGSRGKVIECWRYEYGWDTFIHDPQNATYERSDLTEQDVAVLNAQRILEAQAMADQADAIGMPYDPKDVEPKLVGIETRYVGKWRYYFLTPWGQILAEGDSPYWHEQHPYQLGFAELLDGEIWGIVEDIIDPQRLINRLTQSIDFMFAAGAKGVLLIPEDAIPEGMSLDEFASEWTKFRGVIRYKAKQGVELPKQITAASIPVGIFNWLGMMQSDIKEVSGVSGPVQGMDPNSGTPARLYEQQIMQAQTTTRDLFDNFFSVRKRRDLRVCQLVQQFYNESKMIRTAGWRPDGTRYLEFDPARVRDIEFDVVVSDAPDSPAFRQQAEELLSTFLQQNRLTFRQYLQMSSHPKADAMLAMIEQTNPLLGDQQIDPAMAMDLQRQAAGGSPDAMALISQAQ